MGVHGNAVSSDMLTIFVMDEMPRFIAYRPNEDNSNTATFKVKKALYDLTARHDEYDTRPYS
jgi:hypothetical protein